MCFHYLDLPVREWHLTPASSVWLHAVTTPEEQSTSLLSLPKHCTVLRAIGPVPSPYVAAYMGIAPAVKKLHSYFKHTFN